MPPSRLSRIVPLLSALRSSDFHPSPWLLAWLSRTGPAFRLCVLRTSLHFELIQLPADILAPWGSQPPKKNPFLAGASAALEMTLIVRLVRLESKNCVTTKATHKCTTAGPHIKQPTSYQPENCTPGRSAKPKAPFILADVKSER